MPARHSRGSTIPVAAIPDQDAEWEGNFLQIKEAIEQGKAETVGLYLRDAAEFLGRLAGLIDGQASSSDWRLEFRRKGRGRRSDPVSRMLKDSRLAMELRFATLHAGKQESALALLKAPGMRPGHDHAG